MMQLCIYNLEFETCIHDEASFGSRSGMGIVFEEEMFWKCFLVKRVREFEFAFVQGFMTGHNVCNIMHRKSDGRALCSVQDTGK
jgi:hypothetical protein